MNTSISLSPWRQKGIAVLRIVFGLVWAIDAWFKWQPDFVNNMSSYLSNPDGQPAWVANWVNFWINIVNVDPHVFAHIVAVAETAIALALILGVFSNLTVVGGILISVVIWTTAESFGGPYVAGSTDIGAAIIYVLVFVGLFFANAGLVWGLDRRLTPVLGRFGFLASGPVTASKRQEVPAIPAPAFQSLCESSANEKKVEQPVVTPPKR